MAGPGTACRTTGAGSTKDQRTMDAGTGQGPVADGEGDAVHAARGVAAGEDPGNGGRLHRIGPDEIADQPLVEGTAQLAGQRARDPGPGRREQPGEVVPATVAEPTMSGLPPVSR